MSQTGNIYPMFQNLEQVVNQAYSKKSIVKFPLAGLLKKKNPLMLPYNDLFFSSPEKQS